MQSSSHKGGGGESSSGDETIDSGPAKTADGEPSAAPAPATTAAPPLSSADDYAELATVERRHYVIGDQIDRGGMGRIYAARDRRLGRPVAIKELLPRRGDAARRFEREARITARLQHPSIVAVYEAGRWPGGDPFYAMKMVSGRSLERVVAERTAFAGRIALLPNVISIADALAYAHSQRIIHRDLKPANVLVGEFGETVVIDWGLAKDLSTPGVDPALAAGEGLPGESTAGAVIGTPAYMPPEQARGAPVDERADVYAVGALLYHVMCGRPPYTGKSTEDVLSQVAAGSFVRLDARAPEVPSDLVAIVHKAMATNAADRYPTANELAEDLKRFQTGQLVGAHRYSTGERLARFVRRRRAPIGVAAAALAVLTVVSVIYVRGIVAAKETAVAKSNELLELRGSEQLLAGRAGKALPYLSAALTGDPQHALRFAIAEAARPFQLQLHDFVTEGPLDVATFDPTGALVLTAGEGGSPVLWSVERDQAKARLDGPKGAVYAAAFVSDGRIAAGGEDGVVRVWDTSGKLIHALEGHTRAITAVSASDDGALLLSTGADDTARVWDVASGRLVAELTGHSAAVVDGELSRDGRTAVTASADGSAIVWDVATGKALRRLPHEDGVNSARFDGSGRLVVTTTKGDVATIWHLDSGSSQVLPGGAALYYAEFSSAGDRVVTAGRDGARIWDAASGQLLRVLSGHADRVFHARFSPDGNRVVTASADWTARVWDVESGALLDDFEGHAAAVVDATFDADGTHVVTAGRDGTARVWSAARPTVVRAWHKDSVNAVACDPAGALVASAGSDGEVQLRDVGSRARQTPLEPVGGEAQPQVVAFSHDGRELAAGTDGGEAIVWDVASGKVLARLAAGDDVTSVQYTADDRQLLTAGDRAVILWDLAGKSRTIEISSEARFAELAPDGRRILLVGDKDRALVDLRGNTLDPVPLPAECTAAHFDARGEHVVAACDDDRARIYDAAVTLRLHATLEGHTGRVLAAAFSPDGALVATGSQDGTVRIWDADTGALLATRRGHTLLAVNTVAFQADGQLLWSGGDDKAVTPWPVAEDTRTPAAVAEFVSTRVPWKLVDNSLRPASEQ